MAVSAENGNNAGHSQCCRRSPERFLSAFSLALDDDERISNCGLALDLCLF